jgi:hypothetical protein
MKKKLWIKIPYTLIPYIYNKKDRNVNGIFTSLEPLALSLSILTAASLPPPVAKKKPFFFLFSAEHTARII